MSLLRFCGVLLGKARAACLVSQSKGRQNRVSELRWAFQILWLCSRANIQKFTNAGCALHFSALAKVSLTG